MAAWIRRNTCSESVPLSACPERGASTTSNMIVDTLIRYVRQATHEAPDRQGIKSILSTHGNQTKAMAALGAWPFTASRDPQNAMLECRATLSRSVPTGRSQVRGPAPSRAPSTSRKKQLDL